MSEIDDLKVIIEGIRVSVEYIKNSMEQDRNAIIHISGKLDDVKERLPDPKIEEKVDEITKVSARHSTYWSILIWLVTGSGVIGALIGFIK